VSVFGEYASYYDLFYVQKDYAAESAYVAKLIGSVAPGARSLLDVGCGTGRHDVKLAEAGFQVHGIDRSADMLRQARHRLEYAAPAVRDALHFTMADATCFDLGIAFDAVVSLFHVVSYLPDDVRLASALACVRRHLRPGAPFVFDFWHAAAIEANPPQVVERCVVEEGRRILRKTIPTWYRGSETVNVRFVVQIEEGGKVVHSFAEDHLMRYFSSSEIERHLADSGFRLARLTEWMSDAPCGPGNFGACAVAVAR